MSDRSARSAADAITASDWARLDDRVSTLEAGQRMIAASNVQLVDQMADITLTLRRQDELIGRNASALNDITKSMKENTEMTRAIRDVVITARTGGKFVKWVTPTLVALGLGVGVIKGWWLAGLDWLGK